MATKFFEVIKKSKRSQARIGKIKTEHGVVFTPAFVPVATKGTIKTLMPNLIKDLGVQLAFVNTYHLVNFPGIQVIKKAGGIHKFSSLEIPLMSDSGGFQVFSLSKENFKKRRVIIGEEEAILLKNSMEGVVFRSLIDGKEIIFTPEKSMEYQKDIGADFVMAFDECISYPINFEKAKNSTKKTHHWLERCLALKNKLHSYQYFYGIIQGSVYRELREYSAKFVLSKDIDGVAIGGVSVGESKKEMRDVVRWISGYLPDDKPVHLLGVGYPEDILDLVRFGIDTFDCVEPTRIARMGHLLDVVFDSKNLSLSAKRIDIFKSKFKNDLSRPSLSCQCYTCMNFTKAYLHHLFRSREILGYVLLTYHNLYTMEKFLEKIRKLIEAGRI